MVQRGRWPGSLPPRLHAGRAGNKPLYFGLSSCRLSGPSADRIHQCTVLTKHMLVLRNATPSSFSPSCFLNTGYTPVDFGPSSARLPRSLQQPSPPNLGPSSLLLPCKLAPRRISSQKARAERLWWWWRWWWWWQQQQQKLLLRGEHQRQP